MLHRPVAARRTRWTIGIALALVFGPGWAAGEQPIGVQWIQQLNGSALRLKADGWEAGLQSQAREPDRVWLEPGAGSGSDVTLAGDFAWREDDLSVITRFDYHALAPRAAFNGDERDGSSVQTSVQQRIGKTRLSLDWQEYGEDYALPTDIWFAGDRKRRALRLERPWAGGQLMAGLAKQERNRSKPHRMSVERRWVGWHGVNRSGGTFRVEFEVLDRTPTGSQHWFDGQSEARLRVGLGRQLGRILVTLNSEIFRQTTLRGQELNGTQAGILNLAAETRLASTRFRAWTTASNFELENGHDAAVHAGFQAIADTLWQDVFVEIGIDRAYRSYAWSAAPISESHANGRLRWTPRHLAPYLPPNTEPSLELVADLREHRSGGEAELADPTFMLIWTVR